MTFDPAAATAAYIDSLGADALAKAADYTAGNHWVVAAAACFQTIRCLSSSHAALNKRFCEPGGLDQVQFDPDFGRKLGPLEW